MILASHVIISCYGFWLPNEERGSWSEFVRSWDLFRGYGPATKVATTRSVANRPYDRKRRWEARHSLLYPPVELTGEQARAIATAFALKAHKSGYLIYACAILPTHSHLVVGRHRYGISQVVNLLKGTASSYLLYKGLHPLAQYRRTDGSVPSVWASKYWKVILDSNEDVRRAIKYVDDNPEKERKRRQTWKFVVPFEG
jgi:REP element-mobilizing transposase RayT